MPGAVNRISTAIDFDRDGKQEGFLRLPYSVHRSAYGWIPIPIICIKNGGGPRVLLVAGNHGDEYEGQVALMKLCRALDASDVRGRLIILPAANFPAVKAGRRTSPIDDGGEGNLNRSFPGDPNGFPTAMIAHYIEGVLLPMSEYVFDLHSGGSSLALLPSAYMKKSGNDARDKRAIEIMKVFGAPISYIDLVEDDRTMSAAARRSGTIHMGTELGGSGTVSREALAIGEQGLRRVLRHVGALEPSGGDEEAPETRLVVVGGADYYVYGPDDGLFEPFVELGDTVEGGQPAGAVHFPDTPWREPSIASFGRSGLVICKRVPGRVERGDCLFHLATDYGE